MKICIRDDDLSFFTNFSEFDNIYRCLNVPVSISAVPYAYPKHCNIFPYGHQEEKCRYIGDNKELIKCLKQKIGTFYEIELHGFDHKYLQSKNGLWIPELIYKTKQQIFDEEKFALEQMSKLFETEIKVLVAPANEINSKGIYVAEQLGLNYSGVLHGLTRKFDLYFIKNFLISYITRFRYGISLGGLLRFKNHNELNIIGKQSLNEYIRLYQICKKKNWDMCIVTHYWQLNENKVYKQTFYEFINYLKKENAEFAFLSQILKGDNNGKNKKNI